MHAWVVSWDFRGMIFQTGDTSDLVENNKVRHVGTRVSMACEALVNRYGGEVAQQHTAVGLASIMGC